MRAPPLEEEEHCQAWKQDHGNAEGLEMKLESQGNKGDAVTSLGFLKKSNFLNIFFPSETPKLLLIFGYAGDHPIPQLCREGWPSKLVCCLLSALQPMN